MQSPRELAFRHAFWFFFRAARFGDPEGMWDIGWRYWLGEGVKMDDSKAVPWWKQAALNKERLTDDDIKSRRYGHPYEYR